ncbi:MAG: nodulation protein NfeD, partial [Dehalococcoidia bacterium]|nr:nodulation protein NfeD [Dehalococcoidia bacterium]
FNSAGAQGNSIAVLKVKGAITPVVAGYLERGITAAESAGASVVVIEMDTPGGLDTSMREIVQTIIGAKIPVVVFVSPAGARAASAGAFITLAAHVAVMAPNTAIGAAHPVSIGSGGATEVPETMEEKIVNDAVAYIRSSAALRNRNVEWAEKIVRESVSATETEALQLKVIDFIANDTQDLIRQLDGRQVTLLSGQSVTLQTGGASIIEYPMTGTERFLFTLSNPNLAYILLSVAMLGILLELYNPGAILPGIVGGIALFLALYSLGMLEANWAGLLLIALAFVFFAAEFFTSSFGMLLIGGVISLIFGSLLLFPSPEFSIDIGLIAGVVGIITVTLTLVLIAVLRTHKKKQVTGVEGMIGRTGVVRTALNPKGTILVHGELWAAVSRSGVVEPGEDVEVEKVDGLRLSVSKINSA